VFRWRASFKVARALRVYRQTLVQCAGRTVRTIEVAAKEVTDNARQQAEASHRWIQVIVDAGVRTDIFPYFCRFKSDEAAEAMHVDQMLRERQLEQRVEGGGRFRICRVLRIVSLPLHKSGVRDRAVRRYRTAR
jgi:hypothetical protein